MEILIRQINVTNDVDEIFTDVALDVKSLNIGCAADQELQLSGLGILPNHATLVPAGDGVRLRCRGGGVVSVNGTARAKAKLSVGDVVEIGGNNLEITAAPDGFDVALLVTNSDSKDKASYEQSYRTDLSQTRLAPRLLSWVLCLSVLVFAIAMPLAYHHMSKSDAGQQAVNAPWLISDKVWSSGPLHEAHASLDESCNSCHVKLFQKVTNDSCNNCHADTQDHIASVSENQHLPIEMNGACASCHREHNEPVSSLIISSNNLCVDCHAPHDLETASSTLARVEGFGVDTHAPFNVSLLIPPEGGSFDTADVWLSSIAPLAGVKENSQLKFDHEVHYDTTKVKLNGDSSLTCAHCHDLSVDGEHFVSIEFEQNCANSGCHELELDPRNRLPHGLPDVTVAAIEGFYLRQFGDPDKPESPTVKERRRVLDRSINNDETCAGSAYECARELAARKIRQQFTTTGCVTCHTVKDVGGEILDRYQVAVVKLNEDYLANSRFDHSAHGVLVEPGGVNTFSGDESCVYCHAAPTSSTSTDVLIPTIDNCTTCHNGPQRTLNVPLGCIDCHVYHEPL